MKMFLGYIQKSLRWRKQFPGSCTFQQLRSIFPDWKRSLQSNSNALSDRQPWMTFSAIKFLDNLLAKDMRVFEYGSGGSSLFFSHRAKEVVSVEHDPDWANRVGEIVRQLELANIQLILAPADRDLQMSTQDPSDPDGYGSSDSSFRDHSFRTYASAIDAFPVGYFDVIVIDGRARPSCFKHALPKTIKGGWIVLDNSERIEYRRIHQLLDGPSWCKSEFGGPGPYNSYFWQTCAWQKLC